MADDESNAPLLGPSPDSSGREACADYITSIPVDDLAEIPAATSRIDADTPFPLPDGKQYHVFICHSHEDIQTAIEVKDYLEVAGLKCCWHKRDFTLGQSVFENMEESIANSVLMVPIVSRSFMESGYCKYELNLLLHGNIRRNLNNVVPVVLCPPKTIPSEIKMLTYIEASEENYLERLFERALHILGIIPPANSTNELPPLLQYGRNTFHQTDTDEGCCSGGCLGMLYRSLKRIETCVPEVLVHHVQQMYTSHSVCAASMSNICVHVLCVMGVITVIGLFVLLVYCLGAMYTCVGKMTTYVLLPSAMYAVDKDVWTSSCDARNLNYRNATIFCWPDSCSSMFNDISVKFCSSNDELYYYLDHCSEDYTFPWYADDNLYYLDDSSLAYIKQLQVYVIFMWLAFLVTPILLILYCCKHGIKYSKSKKQISQFQLNKEKTIAELTLDHLHLIQGCIEKIRKFNPHDNWGNQVWHSVVENMKLSMFYTCCLCGCNIRTLNKTMEKLKKTKEPKDDLFLWFLPKYLQRYHKTKLDKDLRIPVGEWGRFIHIKDLPSPDQFLHLPDVMCFCQYIKMNLETVKKKKSFEQIILWSDEEV